MAGPFYISADSYSKLPPLDLDNLLDWEFDWSDQMLKDSDTLQLSRWRTERLDSGTGQLNIGNGVLTVTTPAGTVITPANKAIDTVNHKTSAWFWATAAGKYRVTNIVETAGGRVWPRGIEFEVVQFDRTTGVVTL